MNRIELVKLIREKAGVKNDDGDVFIAINLPRSIAMEIDAII